MSTVELPTQAMAANGPADPPLPLYPASGRTGRAPTKRELRIWRSVRIDQQSALDVSIEFGIGLVHCNRLVRWIDAMRAREATRAFDAKAAFESLYLEARRSFRLSQREGTKKVVEKRKGSLKGDPTERVQTSTQTRNAGNPAFLKLCGEFADRLSSLGVDRPSRESARMANESERQNIEAIDALRRSGAIGSVTRTERIEFTAAPSAGQSTPERLATNAIEPTGVRTVLLNSTPPQDRAATPDAPPQFSPMDFGPDVVPPLTSIPSPDAPTASQTQSDSERGS